MNLKIPNRLKNEFVGFIELALCNLESNELSGNEVYTKEEKELLTILNEFVANNGE